jgi:malate dehydrogenase
MSFTAILGAGAIGGALAQRLAARGRVREVRLIDAEESVARGMALDILQSSPIDGFSTRISGAGSIDAAAGADVIVIADQAQGRGEHAGEPALAMVRRLLAMEGRAPLVFAGGSQRELMTRTVTELRADLARVIGSAPVALEAAVRALVALELNGTGVDVQVLVAGVPPRRAVVAWESATACGQPLSSQVPPHRLAAIAARVPGLWPPGPLALASAASRIVEGIVNGSRRRYSCFAAIDVGELPGRGTIVALPVEIGRSGIARVLQPALSRQERTQLENGWGDGIS